MGSSKKSGSEDRAAVHFPPPLIYVAAVVLGLAVDRFVRPLGLAGSGDWARPVAIGLGLIGVGLIGAAIGLFARSGQNPEPWRTTPSIVSTGVYRFTRNPMYVGMALWQGAAGLLMANAWIVLLVPVTLAFVYRFVVRHEEAYLEDKFGDQYLAYKQAVRRWL